MEAVRDVFVLCTGSVSGKWVHPWIDLAHRKMVVIVYDLRRACALIAFNHSDVVMRGESR